MSKLINSLQQDLINEKILLSVILRKALIVASKLEISDFKSWIDFELNGYPDNKIIPEYRKNKGQLFGFNPNYGWQPIIFPEPKEEEYVTVTYNRQSIAEIEHLQEQTSQKGELISPLSGEEVQAICDAIGRYVEIKRVISKTDLYKITNSVRNILLNWSIALDEKGIQGVNFDFTGEEKLIAHENYYINSTNYYIGNQGIMGHIENSEVTQNLTVQITKNDVNQLKIFLLDNKVKQSDINKLMEAIKTDPIPTEPGILGKRVSKWIGDMVKKAASGAWEVSLKIAESVHLTVSPH